MNTRVTWWLAGSAIVLFLFICLIDRRLPDAAERSLPPRIFSQMRTNDVTALEIIFGGSTNRLRAEKQYNTWTLVKPKYPAQQTAISSFVDAVAALRAYDKLAPHEVLIQGSKSFGLETPRARVQIETRTNRFAIEVGSATPLTNNIYIRMAESGDVFVTDGRLLENLPASPEDWRSAAMVDLNGGSFNRLQIRTGQRTFEIERSLTNNLLRITKPVPARADQERIAELLPTLGWGRVTAFVAASPLLELDRYGLQTPPLELSLLDATNRPYGIEFGTVTTNVSRLVYAELLGQSNVVAV